MDAGDSAHQRKIELQSVDDLAYLVANVRRAAAAHLAAACPPVEGAQEEDELRTQIEALVDEVSLVPGTSAGHSFRPSPPSPPPPPLPFSVLPFPHRQEKTGGKKKRTA